MANTIGFGQGAVNNTNGFGKAPTNNTIDFGEVCADSWSPETNLVGGTSFSNTYSLEFDGVDDYVALSSATPTMTSFSLSFWSYNAGANYKAIVGHSVTGNGGLLVAIVQSGGYIQYFDNTTSWTNISGQNLNSWNHYVITFDGSTNTLKCYENGTLHTTINNPDYSAAPTNAHSFNQIGRYYSTGYYNSKLDEVAVWNSVLDSTDVSSIYGTGVPNDISSLSPLSWWRFEGSGTTATDSGSDGNNGTLTNGVTRSTDVPT